MARKCIICGGGKKSGEHIFPAALGGRRVNNSIYCGTHNNAFSVLAGILSRQLALVNSLLGVRPDHDKKPLTLRKIDDSGNEVSISSAGVVRIPATLAADDRPIQFNMELGGPEGLRAIAYVALTFFAHYFPDDARDAGLDPMKEFIKSKNENAFVWWESDETTASLPENPFEFGHTILLTKSGANNKIHAIVSLFQTLTFGIELAELAAFKGGSVIVFIDPHADHAPNDIVEKFDNVGLTVRRPYPLHEHLERIVHAGDGEKRLQGLFERIEKWKFRTEMQPILDRLNQSSKLAPLALFEAVKKEVEDQQPKVLRLMAYVVKDIKRREGKNASMKPIIALLAAQIAVNEKADGLTELGEIALAQSLVAIMKELHTKLSKGHIDMAYFWLLFSGGPGAYIVGQAMLNPVLEAFNDLANSLPE